MRGRPEAAGARAPRLLYQFPILPWAPVLDPSSRMTSGSRGTITMYCLLYTTTHYTLPTRYILYTMLYCILALSPPSSWWHQFSILTLGPDVILLLRSKTGARGIIPNCALGTCFGPKQQDDIRLQGHNHHITLYIIYHYTLCTIYNMPYYSVYLLFALLPPDGTNSRL